MNFSKWIPFFFLFNGLLFSDNQTDTISPILPQDSIPFNIRIEVADFTLPNGIHSYVDATYHGKILILAGRTNGMHGFDDNNDNFPPSKQNTVAYVIDPVEQTVVARDLADPSSGLSQEQIDQLSVTSAQHFQSGDRLYISGGYGVNSSNGTFDTKNTLTAIDLPGFIHWITKPSNNETAEQHIRQTEHPWMKVTGGEMFQADSHLSAIMVFGQDFQGYYVPNSNGNYTNQVRRFQIIDTGEKLYVIPKKSEAPDENYRRRDLNVVPIINNGKEELVALSGVFTITDGIWTVPVIIGFDGKTSMADPNDPNTFKQGMNNYQSAYAGLYSKKTKDMYLVILGGISFGFFSEGTFTTDPEFPFINQVTTVRINKDGKFEQFLMEGEYPVILSTGTNPGNQLLFGASARFFPLESLPSYPNNVLQLDTLKKPILMGQIVGGIMSTVPNTNVKSDSTASPYIFNVFLDPA